MWTWTALDPDSKLIVSWLVGSRDAGYARAFVEDIAYRLANRVQLTTDGNKPYLSAVEDAFGMDVDYAMLVKLYGQAEDGERTSLPPCASDAARRRSWATPRPSTSPRPW